MIEIWVNDFWRPSSLELAAVIAEADACSPANVRVSSIRVSPAGISIVWINSAIAAKRVISQG